MHRRFRVSYSIQIWKSIRPNVTDARRFSVSPRAQIARPCVYERAYKREGPRRVPTWPGSFCAHKKAPAFLSGQGLKIAANFFVIHVSANGDGGMWRRRACTMRVGGNLTRTNGDSH